LTLKPLIGVSNSFLATINKAAVQSKTQPLGLSLFYYET